MARVNYDQPPAAAAGSRSPAYPLSVLVSLSVRLPARSGVSLRVRALVRVSVPSARPTVSREALPRNYASRAPRSADSACAAARVEMVRPAARACPARSGRLINGRRAGISTATRCSSMETYRSTPLRAGGQATRRRATAACRPTHASLFRPVDRRSLAANNREFPAFDSGALDARHSTERI